MAADETPKPAPPEKPIISDAYRQGRSMVTARHGMVASSNPLATLAGLDVLRAGGTAMDAAVAVATTLGVVEPMSIGMGGDAWMLYFEAKTGKVYALNGSGRSPQGLKRKHFKKDDKITGWASVTVPGAVDAYWTGHQRFGRLPFADLLKPAIGYAEDGYAVSEIVATLWSVEVGKLGRDPWSKKSWLTADGKAPRMGEVMKLPALAQTLKTIAAGGRDAYYKGPIAQEIVRYAKESGGFFTMADFEKHHSDWVEPVSTNYRGYDVYQCPPNGQGAGVLIMLNLLEGYDLPHMKFNSPEYLHLLIEAKKLAYADLHKFVGDPARGKIPVAGLLSKEYAAGRRRLIDPAKAAPEVKPGIPSKGDTACFSVVDAEGNACSFINSNFANFGSGITGGSTGIMLQNRGEGFTLEKKHFNEYKPGVRPYHTIIPGMVLKGGKLYMSYGLMGGDMQPQGHVQFLLAHLDHEFNIQQAMDIPRWKHEKGLEIRLEEGTPRETIEALKKLGHDTKDAGYLTFGSAQAIRVDPDTGTLAGASDSRRDGLALGY
jgi:gamma-glutamyltranspeptidase/glutathione hydrolase